MKTYLEMCGYFVLTDLRVRAADPRGYHGVTDLDILAVRFPHKRRRLGDVYWMCSHPKEAARLIGSWVGETLPEKVVHIIPQQGLS